METTRSEDTHTSERMTMDWVGLYPEEDTAVPCSTFSGCGTEESADCNEKGTESSAGNRRSPWSSESKSRCNSGIVSEHFPRSSRLLLMTCVFWLFVVTVEAGGRKELPDLSKIPTPPTFVHKKNPEFVYYVLEETVTQQSRNSHYLKEVELKCVAKGYPNITYKWLKDGNDLNVSEMSHRVIQVPGEGTLKLTKLLGSDKGKYECTAENGNGKAVDSPIRLLRTYIKRFVKDDPELVEVEVSDPYSRTCNPPSSVPDPKVYWIFMGEESGTFHTINSSHISSTDEGTIYFHYIKDDDYREKIYYTCTAENSELKDYKFGNRFQFIIKHTKRRRFPAYIPPSEQYVSPGRSALRGQEVKLHCFFSGFPDLIPIWYKNGKNVDSVQAMRERTEFENTGRTLVISNISESDAGTYTCKFEMNQNLNRDISLDVQAAPYYPHGPPASKNASEGDSVKFVCDAQGNPGLTFKFYKNGKEIETDSDEGYEVNGYELHIRNLRKGSGGTGHNAVYQCLAKNDYGEAWSNFYLNILAFKPVILEGPGDTDSVLNKEKFLECKVFGSPVPTIEWRGQAVMGNNLEQIPVNQDGVARLRIGSVQKSDEGTYMCHAENKYGTDETSGVLTVRDATRLTKYMKAEETVFAGVEHRFMCAVAYDKNLDVTVTWLMNGVKLSEGNFESGRMRREDGEIEHSLIIPETSWDDTGIYTCVAETRLDDVKRTGKLIVKDVPPVPHSSFVGPCDVQAKTVVIRINYNEYTDTPAPVQEFWVEYLVDPDTDSNAWMTYPNPVANFKATVEENLKSISVPVTVSLKPYGMYRFRVIARNEVGDSSPAPVSGTCNTSAAVPYTNPADVVVKGNTADNLVVYWEPMPREEWNGPGFKYQIEYRAKDGEDGEETEWETVDMDDPYADHVVVNNVPTYKEYEARVRAVNDLGKAEVEPQSHVGYSGEGIPDTAPTGFAVKEKTPSTVTFLWDRVEANRVHGELKGFKIYHWYDEGTGSRKRRKRESGKEQVAYFDATATEGTVYGMKPNRNNYAAIVVYNGANDSPRSKTLEFFLSPGPPSPVQELNAFALSSTEVGVVWRPPREANGELLGYMVNYCPILTDEDGVVNLLRDCPGLFVKEPTRHYRWSKLEASTEYRFEVRAKSSGGVGDPSSVDEWTLSTAVVEGVPYQPSLLDAGIADDHINVTWVPGKFDQENPQPVGNKHEIKYRVKGANEWQVARPESGNFTVQLRDLYPGTRYEVVGVSVVTDEDGNELARSESPPYYYTTAGERPSGATAAWLIAIIVAIIILIIILIIVCLVVRNRGAKYPVSEKEREQGREPMLSKEEKGFGEYARPDMDDEKKSLTGDSKAESETDSMAEYGDGETGRFTEDGSFIGVYGAQNANRVLIPPPSSGGVKSNLSTFV